MAGSDHSGMQTAAVVPNPGPNAQCEIRHDIPIPVPQPDQVLVKLTHSGICHSDVHSIYNETPMETDIAGHEGVGIVVKLGSSAEHVKVGDRVGIKWQWSVCGTCAACAVDETACPNQNNSGRNVRGCFAQYQAAPAKDVTLLPPLNEDGSAPDGLSSELLAPLLCAGLSMYSSISKANLKAGEWLVLPGAGGGLGHLGVQIAKAKGYKVIAVDSGEAKRKLCVDELGADAFLDFKTDDIEAEVLMLTDGVGAHAVVVGVGSTAAYELAFKLVRRLGTLVCVGIPRTNFHLPVSPFEMIVRSLKVVGSSCGTRESMSELLELAKEGKVRAKVEVRELDAINDVVKGLANFEIGGRVVLRITQ
jgi:alcohol dehydrogenase, propanol-preferring